MTSVGVGVFDVGEGSGGCAFPEGKIEGAGRLHQFQQKVDAFGRIDGGGVGVGFGERNCQTA